MPFQTASGYILDRLMTGHIVIRRGPVVVQTRCGQWLVGRIFVEPPERICPNCLRRERIANWQRS